MHLCKNELPIYKNFPQKKLEGTFKVNDNEMYFVLNAEKGFFSKRNKKIFGGCYLNLPCQSSIKEIKINNFNELVKNIVKKIKFSYNYTYKNGILLFSIDY